MKKLAVLISMLTTFSVSAAQCRVDIKNEIRLDGEAVEIHQQNGDKARVDSHNNLYIHGEKIELSQDQQAAIESYRENLNAYLPKAKQLAADGLAFANDVIDDIAASLDAPGTLITSNRRWASSLPRLNRVITKMVSWFCLRKVSLR